MVLKNVVYKEYSSMTGFVDIWALVTSAKSQADMDEIKKLETQSKDIEYLYNNLDAQSLNPPEYIQFDKIQYLINGFARTVWYYSAAKKNGRFTPIGNETRNKVFQMREGECVGGWMHGFNR